MHKYKYLLWDIDGTVLDFKASEKAAIKKLFAEFELGECSDEMVSNYSSINSRYWEALERNEMTKSEILVRRFIDFFTSIGIDSSIAEAFNKEYQYALGDTIAYCENSKEILKSEQNEYILIAITNGTEVAQVKKLALSGLDQIFNYVYISEKVGHEKPNKEFFDYVIKESKIKDKGEMLIIGDSLTSDILGGKISNIDTCWYNPNSKSNATDIIPTYEIKHLSELSSIIK